MDDVLLLEVGPRDEQELPNTNDKMAEKYHIKFGKKESQNNGNREHQRKTLFYTN